MRRNPKYRNDARWQQYAVRESRSTNCPRRLSATVASSSMSVGRLVPCPKVIHDNSTSAPAASAFRAIASAVAPRHANSFCPWLLPNSAFNATRNTGRVRRAVRRSDHAWSASWSITILAMSNSSPSSRRRTVRRRGRSSKAVGTVSRRSMQRSTRLRRSSPGSLTVRPQPSALKMPPENPVDLFSIEWRYSFHILRACGLVKSSCAMKACACWTESKETMQRGLPLSIHSTRRGACLEFSRKNVMCNWSGFIGFPFCWPWAVSAVTCFRT